MIRENGGHVSDWNYVSSVTNQVSHKYSVNCMDVPTFFQNIRDTSKQSIAKFISSGEWLPSLKYMAAVLIFSLLEQMFLQITKMFLGDWYNCS